MSVSARDLQPMQTHVLYLLSDRAKALIKLAKTGWEWLRLADLFHLLHELAKGASLSRCRQLNPAHQQLSQAQETLGKGQLAGANEAHIESAQPQVAVGEASVNPCKRFATRTGGYLEAISLQVHPWRVEGSVPQSAQEGEAQLGAEVTGLQAWREANGLPVNTKVLAKV
jgi:hypothetical protein